MTAEELKNLKDKSILHHIIAIDEKIEEAVANFQNKITYWSGDPMTNEGNTEGWRICEYYRQNGFEADFDDYRGVVIEWK